MQLSSGVCLYAEDTLRQLRSHRVASKLLISLPGGSQSRIANRDRGNKRIHQSLVIFKTHPHRILMRTYIEDLERIPQPNLSL